jgi:hypothetical protein
MRLRTVLFIAFGWEWSAGVRGSLQKDQDNPAEHGGLIELSQQVMNEYGNRRCQSESGLEKKTRLDESVLGLPPL